MWEVCYWSSGGSFKETDVSEEENGNWNNIWRPCESVIKAEVCSGGLKRFLPLFVSEINHHLLITYASFLFCFSSVK